MTRAPPRKRARIVLLAADGRSTRSIAKEVGVQPRMTDPVLIDKEQFESAILDVEP